MTSSDVTRSASWRTTAWLMSALAGHVGDAMAGDLAEEYALRASARSAASVSRWYWSQVGRSVWPLFWAAVRRGGWIAPLAVGAAVCGVVVLVVGGIDAAVGWLFAGRPHALEWTSFSGFVIATALGGHFAARLQHGAPMVLAVLMVLCGLTSLAMMEAVMPLWQQMVFLIVGFSASLGGGHLRA